MPARTRLSLSQARRIALAAQGFGEARPEAPGARHVARTLARSKLFQIDSVNVLVRAHYMPLFSRIGAYDRALLDKAAYHPRKRATFEYWGHEASLIHLDLHPLFRWRMARAARGESIYGGLAKFGRGAARLHRGGAPRDRRTRPDRRGRTLGRRQGRVDPGGAGATASGRSNGCSGPAR